MKKCSKCRRVKPLSDFYKWARSADGYQSQCIKCVRNYHKENLGAPERSVQRLRYRVMSHYCNGTPKCMATGCRVRCFEVLEFDHINGDGAQHRKEFGKAASFIRWLERENFPPVVKVVCANCHSARHKNVRWFPAEGSENIVKL